MILPGQLALGCACGRGGNILALGRCSYCYWSYRLSQRNFGGLRERVLIRDGKQCVCCGEFEPRRLVVHHRRAGVHQMRSLLTLCRRCHVRIHHTWRPRFGFPDPLRHLWREQYPDLAEQINLALSVDSPSAVQVNLFGAA